MTKCRIKKYPNCFGTYPKNSHCSVYLKEFKKLSNNWYLCKKNCQLDLSKIAQSDHTVFGGRHSSGKGKNVLSNRFFRELLDGQEKLVEIEKSLDEKTSEMEKFVDELETENGDMTAILERLTIMENDATLLDVDTGVINVELPVYRQLVDAFVEDSSIDDAIYVLGEALRLGRLESEIYLKKVRNLSRKQFFLRAIMIKCRERAGLADPV